MRLMSRKESDQSGYFHRWIGNKSRAHETMTTKRVVTPSAVSVIFMFFFFIYIMLFVIFHLLETAIAAAKR